ncbi:MFS transporter [Butyricicoccus faecihominis]|uniref:MFS transporter n=1 Tax=Butyricicoccus faecihominis TaxID=1712515 RepID=UPI002479E9CC|nr:MFS transporter [Butyricicoccus faecihominis]MCQ5128457.1 MFS transporter [Butyricicoccus faecihominis]
MKKQSFFGSLVPRDRFMVGNLFFLYLIQGIFTILIGSILPMMKAEYGLDYRIGGFLISAHSIGNQLTALIAGLVALGLGTKRSLLMFNAMPFIGFALTLVTGNPLLLIFALLLTGVGRGAISNYNNQIISSLSGGSAAPLNMLHGFFAIGAVSAPFLVLFCTRNSDHGWRYAVIAIIVLGIISMISSPFMKMDSAPSADSAEGGSSFGFLKDRQLLLSAAIMFFYQCVEASVMGWMVTYYIDSGVATQDSAQLLTSLLWVTILIGRFACSALASRFSSARIILFLCSGIILFLIVLLFCHSLVPMLFGTIGLGLSLSGMYGTTVANAGDVFGKYPLAMGVFVTASGIGAIITPSIIGAIAQHTDMRLGMGVLLFPAVIALLLAIRNRIKNPG